MRKKYTYAPKTEEFKALLGVLKGLLKDRGITYRDLAKKLNLSESGVKKILSSDDCSFQRLVDIANVLGVKISDLLYEVEHQEMKSVQFTPKQQQVFLKDKDLFNFFIKLVIERMPVEDIQAESKLTKAQTFKYLKSLDDLSLIRLLPENKIKVPDISLISDFGTGPLLNKAYQEWGNQIVQDLAKPELQASGQFIIRSLKMKDETYQEFLSQLRELERHFATRALREMAVSTTRLKLIRWMSFTDQNSFIPGSLHQIRSKERD